MYSVPPLTTGVVTEGVGEFAGDAVAVPGVTAAVEIAIGEALATSDGDGEVEHAAIVRSTNAIASPCFVT